MLLAGENHIQLSVRIDAIDSFNTDRNVLEFDSFEELREQVPEYLTSSGCHIMEAIAERLKCEEKDLYGFAPVKKGNHVSES